MLNVSYFTIYSVIFGRISIILNKKQQFLQWIIRASEPSQKCMEKTHPFDCKNALIQHMPPTNAISCCKYVGSVSGTFVFSMLLIHFDKEIAFRLRGVTAMCAKHQFLQWIVTTYGDIPRSCLQAPSLTNRNTLPQTRKKHGRCAAWVMALGALRPQTEQPQTWWQNLDRLRRRPDDRRLRIHP